METSDCLLSCHNTTLSVTKGCLDEGWTTEELGGRWILVNKEGWTAEEEEDEQWLIKDGPQKNWEHNRSSSKKTDVSPSKKNGPSEKELPSKMPRSLLTRDLSKNTGQSNENGPSMRKDGPLSKKDWPHRNNRPTKKKAPSSMKVRVIHR